MIECRTWRIIILAIILWKTTDVSGTANIAPISSNEEENKKLFESNKYIYSWTGPNALARSALVERQERLQYNCELESNNAKVGALNQELFRNILVDDLHGLLYCYVPKVACTNWKRMLMIIMGKWQGNDPLEIPAYQAHSPGIFRKLNNYTLPEIEKKLMTYNKLIVVRHPLERLLSAYRNKLETKHERSARYFQSRFGKRIIKKYRSNATEESLKNGDDVTFREFVDFITDDSENGTQNEHWKPIYELCQPCTVNYNLVSKYESLIEDATEVLERIGITSVRKLNAQTLPQWLNITRGSGTLRSNIISGWWWDFIFCQSGDTEVLADEKVQ